MRNTRGFTLVELLVVITIIAVLSAIAMVSYSNVLKTSRDSKRLSDLKLIQSALEEYHADQIYYPDEGLNLANDTSITNCSGNVSTCTVTRTYLNSIPADPLSSNPQYNYQPLPTQPTNCDNSGATKCTKYCIYAKMEIPGRTSDSGCTTHPPGYDYGVAKP